MSYFIAGKYFVSTKNKTTGKPYTASNIYVCEVITSDNGEGSRFVMCPSKDGDKPRFFVKEDIIKYNDIQLNKKCEISFDAYGNIKGITY